MGVRTGLWFTEDLESALLGHLQHAIRTNEGPWKLGYITALEDVAVSLGVADPRMFVEGDKRRLSRTAHK